MSQDRPNSGVLFKNTRKTQENHPDYTGHGDFNGQPVDIAAWIRTSGTGNKFLSLSLKTPRPRQAQPGDTQAPSTTATESGQPQPAEDDVPF